MDTSDLTCFICGARVHPDRIHGCLREETRNAERRAAWDRYFSAASTVYSTRLQASNVADEMLIERDKRFH